MIVKNGGVLSCLEGDVLPEGDVSGHRQVVELQHVGDALEAGQVLLHLNTRDGSFKLLL